MARTDRERLLADLARERKKMERLSQSSDELRARRDDLILEALRHGIPEATICEAAGVTRGWIWKLKPDDMKRPRVKPQRRRK